MTATALVYAALAAALFGAGLLGVTLHRNPLRRLLGVNVMGLGVFTVLLYPGPIEGAGPDPVPHALVITGLVVAVAGTALGLSLIRRAASGQDGT
ncbi:MAG: NADH-quinone oxidoreductase subunit K [Pseudomonadota bacterium]